MANRLEHRIERLEQMLAEKPLSLAERLAAARQRLAGEKAGPRDLSGLHDDQTKLGQRLYRAWLRVRTLGTGGERAK